MGAFDSPVALPSAARTLPPAAADGTIAVADLAQRLAGRLGGAPVQRYDGARALLMAARTEAAGRRREPPWSGVLLALGLPDAHGLRAIPELKARFPQLPVWVSIWSEEPYGIVAAICAGACGYLVEDAHGAPLQDGLAQLRAGRPALTPKVAQKLLAMLGDPLWSGCAGTLLLPQELGLDLHDLELLRLLARADSPFAARALQQIAPELRDHTVHKLYRQLQSREMARTVPALLRAGALN